MARTTNEIYQNLLAEKERTAALSGLTSTSSTAIWRLMLYVVAFAMNVLEQLWDVYQDEVTATIETIIPHRPKWYCDKVLAFMENKTLIPDTDRYDTTGMSDEDITAARVVKHAVANESKSTSVLIVKVAGEANGKRSPISSEAQVQLDAYLAEIKDAGVRYALVNLEPDLFHCEVDVYYDAMRLPSDVEYDCSKAIENYLENLPFDGEYTNMALIDALQGVNGVKVVELLSAESAPVQTNTYSAINARVTPEAGYFKADRITLNMKAHEV